MSDNIMIDSNVWIYAFMKGNEGRASKATLLIEQTDPIILSTQIVNDLKLDQLRIVNPFVENGLT